MNCESVISEWSTQSLIKPHVCSLNKSRSLFLLTNQRCWFLIRIRPRGQASRFYSSDSFPAAQTPEISPSMSFFINLKNNMRIWMMRYCWDSNVRGPVQHRQASVHFLVSGLKSVFSSCSETRSNTNCSWSGFKRAPFIRNRKLKPSQSEYKTSFSFRENLTVHRGFISYPRTKQ